MGEIEDEHDIDEEAGMVMQRGENDFVVKALLEIEDFNERFGTHFESEGIDTIGGLVLSRFGHMPRRGERVVIDRIEFEVLHADSRRVHLLRLRQLGEESTSSASPGE